MFRALLATLATLAIGCKATPPPSTSDRLLDEFRGSYPIDPPAATPRLVREVELAAAPTEVTLLDGRRLQVWAYNGQVPGPTLRVKLGETLRVRFTNRLPQETTVHWHGVRLPNAMDGVPGLTQPPVLPGESWCAPWTSCATRCRSAAAATSSARCLQSIDEEEAHHA